MKPLTREWIAKAEGDYRTACREWRVRSLPNYDAWASMQESEGRVMTYYENLIKHVHAAMEKHPRSPVVMTTDTFRVVASGKNTRKLAVAIKKYGALGRMTAVFQKPSENQTFRVTGIDRFKITGAEEYKGKKCRVDAERGGSR